MEIKFKYFKNTEYYLHTNSEIQIKGEGIWWVDEENFLEEYKMRGLPLEDFINEYLVEDLDLDLDDIEFEIESYKRLCDYLRNGWDTCAGEIKGEEPRWVVDIDSQEESWAKVMDFIDTLEPYSHRTKYITNLTTKNGWHIITTSFNLQQFKKKYPNIDVRKNNPTVLYIPRII